MQHAPTAARQAGPPPSPPAPAPTGELRRCPTCNRWGGVRKLADDGVTVELDPSQPRGPCREGPWHGSLRGPRNACGQWLQWCEIRSEPPAGESAAG